MAREDLHFRLRIPEELKKRVEAHAQLNGRSMTAEIVSRLTESMNDDARLRIAQDEIDQLKARVAELDARRQALADELRARTDSHTDKMMEGVIDTLRSQRTTIEAFRPLLEDMAERLKTIEQIGKAE